MKDFVAAERFLLALEQPSVREPLRTDAVIQAASDELQRRQARYRHLFRAHGSVVCGSCRFGGCCKQELVRVADVLIYLALQAEFPRPKNHDPTTCSFLGQAGCTLSSVVMPMMCVQFHCSDLHVRAVNDFARQSMNLASHGEDIAALLRAHLLNQYVLADAEARLDIMSPVITLAAKVVAPVRLLVAPSGLAQTTKTAPHVVELVKLYRVPSVPT